VKDKIVIKHDLKVKLLQKFGYFVVSGYPQITYSWHSLKHISRKRRIA
jgi:hypothetical protein